MDNYEAMIGKNIKDVRIQRELSQEALAASCGFSNTTLSAYENGRKIPNLVTIAKIAKQLNVSIERLYYGDENNAFIISAPDEGKKIVNSVYYLWKAGVISYYENLMSGGMSMNQYRQENEIQGVFVNIQKFHLQIKRLILSLNEFEQKKETYPDQEKYLEFLLSSVANEINNEIEAKRKDLERWREEKRILKNTANPYGGGLKK